MDLVHRSLVCLSLLCRQVLTMVSSNMKLGLIVLVDGDDMEVIIDVFLPISGVTTFLSRFQAIFDVGVVA